MRILLDKFFFLKKGPGLSIGLMQGVAVGCQVLTTLVLAFIFSPFEFGLIQTFIAKYMLLVAVLALGWAPWIIRYRGSSKDQKSTSSISRAFSSLFAYLSVILGSFILIFLFLDQDIFTQLLGIEIPRIILFLSLSFALITKFCGAFLRCDDRPVVAFAVAAFSRPVMYLLILASILLITVVLGYRISAEQIILFYLLSFWAPFIYSASYFFKTVQLAKGSRIFQHFLVDLKKSGALGFAVITGTAMGLVDTILIAHVISYEAAGIYRLALQFFVLLSMLDICLRHVYGARLVREDKYMERAVEETKKSLFYYYRVFGALILSTLTIVVIFLDGMTGEYSYEDFSNIFFLMCIFKLIDLFIGPVESLQIFTGDEVTYLIIAAITLTFSLVIGYIVLTYIGLLAGVFNFCLFSCFRKCLIRFAQKNNQGRMA